MSDLKTYSIRANAEEQRLIEILKQRTRRKTFSDLVRHLMFQEAEKFLPPTTMARVSEKAFSVK